MNDRSSDVFPEGLDRNQDIPQTDYASIIESELSFPYVVFLERRDNTDNSLQIRPPEYSSSRLTNFILFEQQRKKLAIRSKYINELTNEKDDPFALLLANYLIPAIASNSSGTKIRRSRTKESKPPSYNLRIQTRLNLSGSEVEKIIQKIDSLPTLEELHLIEGVQERFSYEIAHAKQAAQDLYASKQYENTIKICRKYLERFPEDLEMLFTLGFSYHDSGNIELAEAAFKLILESFYENAYAWFNLATIYQQLNDYSKELFCLKRALAFGYPADNARIEELANDYTPVDPFAD
ncbi:MAG TPA: tetratricopeptide repeat protein [Candidatus Lokiarchaeia archaeon]|nr:tetratricopeptide repeat protein [Candidatus Lokiarchaeia archaeon]